MRFVQILSIVFTAASSSHQKFDINGKPKCCSGTLSPSYQKLQPWTASLRAATYQSIIRHLDFPGSLDGRLDRDEKLWQHLQEAKFITDTKFSFDDLFEETATGVLIERPQNNQGSTFEFQQTDKFDFECPGNNCHSFNNSLLAIWRVRKSDSPNSMWIRVKLPKIRNIPMEDMYYYSAKYGLKKLSPDPTELNYFKRHRFSTTDKKKHDFKYLDRMDFRFPNFKNIYRTGRVTPSSFMYDSPVYPDSEEDDWYGSSRKPFSEDTFGTDGRYPHHSSSFHSPSRPYDSLRPHAYDHFSHVHPSIPPSQELDHPSQEVRGFMPSVGPINAPPPYRTEYAYDPRYLMYYTNQQNRPFQHTTEPPKHFKPSTEYVRYSEIDPFFHPDSEGGIEQTSPMPQDIPKPMQHYPSSINDQLPTNPFLDSPKPFQIVVKNMNSQSHTFPKPTLDENFPPERKPPSNKLPPVTDRPEVEEEVSVIAFGEKIKPRTRTTTTQKTPTTKETFKMKSEVTAALKTQTTEATTTEEPQDNPSITVDITTIANQDNETPNTEVEFIMNSTQSADNRFTTEVITESTNSDDIDKPGFTNFDTTQNIMDANEMLGLNLQATVSTDESEKTSLGKLVEVNTTINSDMTTDDTTTQTQTDDNTEGTTLNGMESTTDTMSDTDVTDFFSSLANLFSTDSATTEMKVDEATTETSTTQQPATDPDTQESRHQNINYRLLTFPGDPVSIVANRISKTVTYRTAKGKERKLHGKQSLQNRHRFSSVYKDYSKIL